MIEKVYILEEFEQAKKHAGVVQYLESSCSDFKIDSLAKAQAGQNCMA